MKRRKEGACSTSYPSGNQVDGLPLVASTKTVGKRKSRRPRTQMLLTMTNVFLNNIASRNCLGITINIVDNVLKLCMEVVKPRNDKEISEFYRSRSFHGGDILMKILKKIKIFEKNQD